MKIGSEVFSIPAESKKSMDVEIVYLLICVYSVVYIYALGYLSWPFFYLIFHFFYMRFFMGNHDRFHSDRSRRWPRPIELFAEYFALAVTPWDEPYDSIRDKHFIHHKTHMPKKPLNQNILEDPHSIYEAGGFWRSLFFCIFFEEAQLIIDIRNKHITPSRWIRLAIYTPILVLFIFKFGWSTYFGVFFAVRLMSASGWLVFSWFIHTHFYRFGAVRQIPKPALYFLALVNGARVGNGIFRHTSHHAWPSIPSNKLHILDEAILRNPKAMPKMVVTSP